MYYTLPIADLLISSTGKPVYDYIVYCIFRLDVGSFYDSHSLFVPVHIARLFLLKSRHFPVVLSLVFAVSIYSKPSVQCLRIHIVGRWNSCRCDVVLGWPYIYLGHASPPLELL